MPASLKEELRKGVKRGAFEKARKSDEEVRLQEILHEDCD